MAIKSRAIRRIMPVPKPKPKPAGRRLIPLVAAYFAVAFTLAGGLASIALFGDPMDAEPFVEVVLDPAVLNGASGPRIAATASSAENAGPGESAAPALVALNPAAGDPAVPELQDTPAQDRDPNAPSEAPDAAQPVRAGPAESETRFDPSDPRPRVAILISGMGLSRVASRHALETLPADISLAFAPHGDDLQVWADRARANGHEAFLELPMEPFDYPENDPGPYTLRSDGKPGENLKRLEWLLARFEGYQGVVNHLGGKFTSTRDAFGPFLDAIQSKGLMYLDDGTSHRSLIRELGPSAGLAWAHADRTLDSPPAAPHIERQLLELETLARNQGAAIGVGMAYPVTVDRVADWAESLTAKGLVLAPVSAIMTSGRSAPATPTN